MPDASELMQYEKYIGPDKAEHLSRVATASTTWTIVATNNKTYAITFDKNFVKKHLYTSTKKADKVLAKAKELFVAAGSLPGKSAVDYMSDAQKALDEAKFAKQLGHRTQEEQLICRNCNHEQKKHFTGSGGPLPSPGPKCKQIGCTCLGWLEKKAYEGNRTVQMKPTINPLEGATTEKNTVIWLNKVDKAAFEKVVVESFIAKEAVLATGSTIWSSDGEHIRWDFGASNKGCVVFIELGKTPAHWELKQGVEVVVKKGVALAADKPVYTVVHMHGMF